MLFKIEWFWSPRFLEFWQFNLDFRTVLTVMFFILFIESITFNFCVNFQIDGLLFYKRSSPYINGITDDCLWLKPHMLIDLLGADLFFIVLQVRGKRFTVCTEIAIILGTVRFTIRGGRLRYKRYDAHFLKKSSVELPFSSFGDHYNSSINIPTFIWFARNLLLTASHISGLW
jgi:hypothetical protein